MILFYFFSFGLKKLVILDILAVLTFFNASTPLLLDPFLFAPVPAAAALSPFPERLVGGIEAASAAADMLARCASYAVKLISASALLRDSHDSLVGFQ